MNDKRKISHFSVLIIPEQCKGCGRCVSACPKKILKIGTNINCYGFKYAVCINDTCVGCGSCFYSCPEPGAISIFIEEKSIEAHSEENEKLEKCQKKKK